MRFPSLLFNIPCTLLLISSCASQSAMTKEDFPEHGFLIVLPEDPTYRGELEKLGPSIGANAEWLVQRSVLVKNTSQRAVAAFGVRFTQRAADGRIATSDIADSQPSSLLDLGELGRYDRSLEGLIMPGAALLVTPDGVIDPLRKSYTRYRAATPLTIIKAQVDSVVFDDGHAIGPDQIGVIKNLKVHVDAQQDLMEEISERLSHGELLHNVLQGLQTTTLTKTEPAVLTHADPSRIYGLVRQQYLDELSATEANAGDEVALRRLRQLKYTTKPNIRTDRGGN